MSDIDADRERETQAPPPREPGSGDPPSDVQASPDSSASRAGHEVADRYRLLGLLGRGAMGEVWRARDLRLGADVAIKLLLPAASARMPRALDRFRFEAQVSSRLSAKTPHVVGVSDVGDDPKTGAFLVMEYVAGRTLREEMAARGVLSPGEVAAILDQVAAALSVAHDDGILHRDLKPSNLMLLDQPGGRLLVKVTDFGLAKALRRDIALDMPQRTTTGTVLGTLSYMSPEQLQALTVDERTDLWALATIAFEALVGRTPFQGMNWGHYVTELLLQPAPPPSSLRRDLPKGLDGFFKRALAKDPADRFASAAEMAAAFRRAIGGLPDGPRAEAGGHARRRRSPLGRSTIAGGVALGIAGALVLLWATLPPASPDHAAAPAPQRLADPTAAAGAQPGLAPASIEIRAAVDRPGEQPAAILSGAAHAGASDAGKPHRPPPNAQGDKSATF